MQNPKKQIEETDFAKNRENNVNSIKCKIEESNITAGNCYLAKKRQNITDLHYIKENEFHEKKDLFYQQNFFSNIKVNRTGVYSKYQYI